MLLQDYLKPTKSMTELFQRIILRQSNSTQLGTTRLKSCFFFLANSRISRNLLLVKYQYIPCQGKTINESPGFFLLYGKQLPNMISNMMIAGCPRLSLLTMIFLCLHATVFPVSGA